MAQQIRDNLKYTQEHEWVRADGKLAVVGISFHAQDTLGDVVYVELPKLGSWVVAGKAFGVVESTKAVSELFAPVSGKVLRVNEALVANPQLVNTEPYEQGWMIEIEMSRPDELEALMDAGAYENFLHSPK
ncbi:MAG: glycine cleavage system protein GcvH [Proteobacteria bacterium]|nr:glycine cleavage system protein GcvH [Cystobacterineae bacterium]MCL2258537.1 glycine cleavage system protein GcvH [Cystobacterineae bacterium]MCL2315126.1 glycine cleavage system protein GcvH [Pseudomonadota bacterium]